MSDEDEQKLVVDYEDGFKPIELSRRYNVSSSTVSRILGDFDQGYLYNSRKRRKVMRKNTGKKLKPCGTNAAYARHLRNKEQPCLPCADAHALDNKMRKNPLPAKDRRKPNACGTKQGYERHRYYKEEPCEPCRRANALYRREQRAAKKKESSNEA